MSRLTGTLEQALSYQHEGVLFRFMDEFAVSREEAESIFLETKRWLWLNSKHLDDLSQGLPDVPESLGIRTSITIIDEMWHTFILFTVDYASFCENSFGRFISHLPLFAGKEDERTKLEKDREFIHYLSYLYDHIGAESLSLWFKEYPVKYSPDRIDTLRIHAIRRRMKERTQSHKLPLGNFLNLKLPKNLLRRCFFHAI
jgi:hypothetical protein